MAVPGNRPSAISRARITSVGPALQGTIETATKHPNTHCRPSVTTSRRRCTGGRESGAVNFAVWQCGRIGGSLPRHLIANKRIAIDRSDCRRVHYWRPSVYISKQRRRAWNQEFLLLQPEWKRQILISECIKFGHHVFISFHPSGRQHQHQKPRRCRSRHHDWTRWNRRKRNQSNLGRRCCRKFPPRRTKFSNAGAETWITDQPVTLSYT